MSMRRNVWFLTVTVVLILGSLVVTLLSDNRPILGLDLQGGLSVVFAPVGKFRQDGLDKAVDIIRQRVDSLGVAEPEISRQGKNIIVDMPGVRDRTKALAVVGQTAELRFRPVTTCVPREKKASNTTSTTAAGSSTTTPGATTATTKAAGVPTTPRGQDKATQPVVLNGLDACDTSQPVNSKSVAPRYALGPTLLTGKAVKTAKASFQPVSSGSNSGWGVDVSFTDSGLSDFNKKVAAPNVGKRVAIVLDSLVQSSPTINDANFTGQVRISGGSFDQGSAEELALVLRFGALPVQLKAQTSENVSPTLGKDQLAAGIAAGLIGLALVALYMLAFYRILGLVVIFGLMLSGAAIYSMISWLGAWIGLTLTLAGVTGLIISVGVTVDSYVVYFERLKDEVRTGRTVRSSVDRGFTRAFKTILAADLVSLIGAGVLWLLAIGSVKGFAFFLGLSTVLDLLLAYFFMHPLVALMAQRTALVATPKVGIAAGIDAPGVSA